MKPQCLQHYDARHLKDETLSGCSDEPAAGSAAEDGPPCQFPLEKEENCLVQCHTSSQGVPCFQ